MYKLFAFYNPLKELRSTFSWYYFKLTEDKRSNLLQKRDCEFNVLGIILLSALNKLFTVKPLHKTIL